MDTEQRVVGHNQPTQLIKTQNEQASVGTISSHSASATSISLKKLPKEEVARVVSVVEQLNAQGIDKRDGRYITLLKILKNQSSQGIQFSPSNSSQIEIHNFEDSKKSNISNASSITNKSSSLTQHQMLQLKAQILAFKYLSRNAPVPAKLLAAIRGFHIKPQSTSSIMQIPKTEVPSTPSQLQSENETESDLQVIQAIGGKPDGMSMAYILQEREKRIKSRLGNRMEELSSLLNDLSNANNSTTSSYFLSIPELKRKAVIELKQLKLLELQKKLRAEITDKLRKTIDLEAVSETGAFKRAARKATPLHTISSTGMPGVHSQQAGASLGVSSALNTGITPAFGSNRFRGVNLTPEQLKRQKQLEFLTAVIQTSRDFKEWHQMKFKLQKKLNKELLAWHANTQKRQQQLEERRQRERLEALRNQNEDEYRKMLQETKNHRLSELLKETDKYLERIGAMLQNLKDRDEVGEMKEKRLQRQMQIKEAKKKRQMMLKQQQQQQPQNSRDKASLTTKDSKAEPKKQSSKQEENSELPEEVNELEEENEESSEADNNTSSSEKNRRYYTMAHSIEEKVTKQPDMIKGGTLKQYQLVGLQWLVSLYNNKLNGILADEMGLGKTIQTISLIAYLMEKKNDNGPYMICVPLSTISNWALEFKKWAPDISLVIYKGKPQVRKQIYRDEIAGGMLNVVLTSYEYVMLDKSDLGKLEWNYIIIDEGHRIKNRNSKLSNVLRQYMSRHRLLLTGTPLQNNLEELWSLLNFLLPHIFNSAQNFEQWFNAPFAFAQNSRRGPKSSNDAIFIAPNEEEQLLIINRLHKVLRPFILRRLKQDVESELPDKVEVILKCELSSLQKRMYKHMVEYGVILNDPNNPKTKRPVKGFNNSIMQLQKICNHPYLFNDEYPVDINVIRGSGKFDLLDRILPKLKRAGHRILIFNQMTQLMSIMEDYFSIRGYNYLRLDGATKSEDRPRLVSLWNDPNSPHWLFILSTKAGGLGLNLQTADTVIIFDTDWNPQADLQAQDRAHRIGSKKEVRVFRLVSHNSVEEKILERATFKLDVDAKVIQAGMFNNFANDRMRKAMLESLLRDEENKEEAELVTDDEQINGLIARDEAEYNLYQQMDKERHAAELAEAKKLGLAAPVPRLMQDDEIPEYLKVNVAELLEDITENYGRGMRERKEVSYTQKSLAELLGEDVDSEEDTQENPRKRKRGDIEKEVPFVPTNDENLENDESQVLNSSSSQPKSVNTETHTQSTIKTNPNSTKITITLPKNPTK